MNSSIATESKLSAAGHANIYMVSDLEERRHHGLFLNWPDPLLGRRKIFFERVNDEFKHHKINAYGLNSVLLDFLEEQEVFDVFLYNWRSEGQFYASVQEFRKHGVRSPAGKWGTQINLPVGYYAFQKGGFRVSRLSEEFYILLPVRKAQAKDESMQLSLFS